MPSQTDKMKMGGNEAQLPASVVFKPPVSSEDLKIDTEHDPEDEEEFINFIQALRRESFQPIAF